MFAGHDPGRVRHLPFVALQKHYGMSYLFISHDLAVVCAMSHRVIVMKDGDVVEEVEAEALSAAPQETYTKELLAAAQLTVQ
jgi:microcin C transport system ATP-binding protein